MTQPSSNNSPNIQFKHLPVQAGPMSKLEEIRPRVLNQVTQKTLSHFENTQFMDVLLGEALYSEKSRIKREKFNFFTRERFDSDNKLWKEVQLGLLKPSAQVDRKALLEKIISHYSEEIGGHFNEEVYRFTTRTLPWGFRWLLNAASMKHFLPWGMTESLSSRLQVSGEISHLQKLAQKGTILLVPTHQSNIDSVLVGYIIYLMSLPPFAYGAGLNLFSNPILSYFMSHLGSYTVDRKKINLIYKQTLKNYSTEILSEGIHSIFFPGGGRSRSGAIESKIKLGLLGTGLQAEINGHLNGNPKPRVYIVPMVTSYHFVIEASSLIEDYLGHIGKHRFFSLSDDGIWPPLKMISFFWKLFASQSNVTVRIGKPLDIYGNFVDEEGESIGPNGTRIDSKKWLTTQGVLRSDPMRDEEYTRELGSRLVSRFHRENTILTSHLVAFTFFEALRKKYPDFDLFRFLRLSLPQRSLPWKDFLIAAEIMHKKIIELADQGECFLSVELRNFSTEEWVKDGMSQIGQTHNFSVLKVKQDVIFTEDMNLLYYYRNRLAGYGISRFGNLMGEYDAQGFLA